MGQLGAWRMKGRGVEVDYRLWGGGWEKLSSSGDDPAGVLVLVGGVGWKELLEEGSSEKVHVGWLVVR